MRKKGAANRRNNEGGERGQTYTLISSITTVELSVCRCWMVLPGVHKRGEATGTGAVCWRKWEIWESEVIFCGVFGAVSMCWIWLLVLRVCISALRGESGQSHTATSLWSFLSLSYTHVSMPFQICHPINQSIGGALPNIMERALSCLEVLSLNGRSTLIDSLGSQVHIYPPCNDWNILPSLQSHSVSSSTLPISGYSLQILLKLIQR